MPDAAALNVTLNGHNQTKSAFDEVIGSAKELAGVLGVGLGLDALKEGVKSVVEAFGEQQAVEAQTNATIASTGDVSGVTAQQVAEFSDKMSGLTQYSDNTIGSMQNVLLTFRSIGSDVFPKAATATMDLAQAMHLDLNNAALMVGKALNDPILGVTTLRREGVQLSDSQAKMVQGFVNTGQTAQAQAIIIKELETEFGNSAVMYGQTVPGQLAILGNSFDKVKEDLGGVVSAGLAPMMTALNQFVSANPATVAAMIAAGVATVAIGAAVYGLTVAVGALTVAMLPTIGALVVLAALVGGTLYNSFKDAMGSANDTNKALGENKAAAGGASDATQELTKAQAALADQLKQIQQGIADENASYQQNLGEMVRAHEDQLTQSKADMADEIATFEQNENDKQRKYQETIDSMTLSHTRFLEDSKLQLDQENAAYAESRQKILDKYLQSIALQQQKGTEVSALQVQQLQAQEAQELSDLDTSHTEKLASLQTALERQNEDYAASTAKTNQQYQEDTANAAAAHDAKVTKTQQSIDTEQGILGKHAADVAAVQGQTMLDDIDKLEKTHAKALQNYQDQTDKALKAAGEQTAAAVGSGNSILGNANVIGPQIGQALGSSISISFSHFIAEIPRNFINMFAKLGDFVGQMMAKLLGIKQVTQTSLEDSVKSFFDNQDAVGAQNNQANAQAAFNASGQMGPVAPGKAAGGAVSGGSVYQVNENGQEFFQPSVGGNIIPVGHGGGGGGNITINIQGDLNVDSEERKNQLISEISYLLGQQGTLARNGGL